MTGSIGLDILKKGGVDVVVVGIESSLQEELDFFKKIAKPDDNEACIEAFNEYDKICAIYGFMMFTPISTIDSIRTKIMTLDRWGRAWDFLNMTNKTLCYYGTRLHDELIDRGLAERGSPLQGYVKFRFWTETLKNIVRGITVETESTRICYFKSTYV